MEKYDLIVVGSGPGGQRAAIQAAKFGKRAAFVEKLEVIGGTAINTGTIPSKTIREAVLHLSGYQYQSIYGVNYRVKEPITMADLSFRALNVIKTEIDVIRAQLSRNGIDVLTGMASFIDPHRMHVTSSRGQSELESEHIVIATGTKPAVSPLVPFNDKTIINSDQILKMPEIPKSMIVVGGGVIGVEYVCMFATLGVRVTLIEKRPRLLEFADAEMVEALCYHLRDRRVTLRLNEEVESVEETPEHGVVANLKSKKKVSGDALLYAVGRQGNVDELNLPAAGLEADSRGRIKAESTELSHVTALVTHYALAHPDKHFELHSATHALLIAPPVSKPVERLYQIFGSELVNQLLPIAAERPLEHAGLPEPPPWKRDADYHAPTPGFLRLSGFLSKPELQKLNRNSIYVFVNQRLVRDRLILHAVSEAYRNIMPPTSFPVILMFLEMPPEEVDVNVHPAKTEVRFRQSSFYPRFRARQPAQCAHPGAPRRGISQALTASPNAASAMSSRYFCPDISPLPG